MAHSAMQYWEEANRRLQYIEAELPIPKSSLETLFANLPLRMPRESFGDWFKRAYKLAQIIPFPKIKFVYQAEFIRLAADSQDSVDALPDIPLFSTNEEFRLQVESMADGRLRLRVEALGMAFSRVANKRIAISGGDNKDFIISLIQLDNEGEGLDETLEDTPAIREALLRPVIAIIEELEN